MEVRATEAKSGKNKHVILNAARQLQGKLSPPRERPAEKKAVDEPDFADTFSCFA